MIEAVLVLLAQTCPQHLSNEEHLVGTNTEPWNITNGRPRMNWPGQFMCLNPERISKKIEMTKRQTTTHMVEKIRKDLSKIDITLNLKRA